MKKKRVFSAEEKMQILREVEEFGTTETCRKNDLANSLF
jgi:transposase-like protein